MIDTVPKHMSTIRITILQGFHSTWIVLRCLLFANTTRILIVLVNSSPTLTQHNCVYQDSRQHNCVYQDSRQHNCVYQDSRQHNCVYQDRRQHNCVYQDCMQHKCVYQDSRQHKCVYQDSRQPNYLIIWDGPSKLTWTNKDTCLT